MKFRLEFTAFQTVYHISFTTNVFIKTYGKSVIEYIGGGSLTNTLHIIRWVNENFRVIVRSLPTQFDARNACYLMSPCQKLLDKDLHVIPMTVSIYWHQNQDSIPMHRRCKST